jgi:hypothetical protein
MWVVCKKRASGLAVLSAHAKHSQCILRCSVLKSTMHALPLLQLQTGP